MKVLQSCSLLMRVAVCGSLLAPFASAGELQVEIRKPIVNPGGMVVACSMEFAAVLRLLAEQMPTEQQAEHSFEIVNWDDKCPATDFDFKTANGSTVKVSVKSSVFGKPPAGKKYLLLGQVSEGSRAVCEKLIRETKASCILFQQDAGSQ